MIKWDLSEYDRDQLVGLDFETIASGYMEIPAVDNPGSDSISIPFLVWFPFASSSGITSLDQYDLAIREKLDELRFIHFRLDEDPSESYYLVVPELDINPFRLLDGAEIDSDSYDIFYEEGVFAQLLKEDYPLVNIVEAELDIPDLVPVSVPEPSSAFGVLVFGVVFLGVFLKRSLSGLTK